MSRNKQLAGHLAAVLTVITWGTTFISTKLLLASFTPLEILIYRFLIGSLALTIAYPKRLKGLKPKQEALFAAAGLCGITLYFLMENIALTYTLASNVGVILSISPFFTALFSKLILKDEKLNRNFLVGFVVALVGVFLIHFNGSVVLELNPIGDLLAILAAIVWAIYSVLTKRISHYGYNTIQTTRRAFYYGLLFMLPALFFLPFDWDPARFLLPLNTANLLFLGLGASALCFVTWALAVLRLGAIRTSMYIYLVPVVTVISSVLILNETITWLAALGTALILLGLILSERRSGEAKTAAAIADMDV